MVVATFQHIPPDMVGTTDILLLPYGEESTGLAAMDAVTRLNAPRRYVFVQAHRRHDRHLQLRLEQFGGRVLRFVEKRRVPVRVLMMPVPDHAVAPDITALRRKRSLIWHNSIRNGCIAELATALVARDTTFLHRIGCRDEDLRPLDYAAPRVVVVVESPEHGRRLWSLLPGWKVLDLMPRETGESQANKPRNTDPVIVTQVFAGTKPIRADIVIRATGTEFPVRVKGFPRRMNYMGANEALLIDFLDHADTGMELETRRRVAEYQRRGMMVIRPMRDQS